MEEDAVATRLGMRGGGPAVSLVIGLSVGHKKRGGAI